MKYKGSTKKQNAIYTNMFRFASKLLNPKSKTRRVFISCLHLQWHQAGQSLRERLKYTWAFYIMDKVHSGFYPYRSTDQLVNNATSWFKLENRKDTTLDYYMTSVLNPTHFGTHRFKMTCGRFIYLVLQLILDPTWFHKIIWYHTNNWMYHFDKDNIEKSPIVHYWLTWVHKKSGDKVKTS